MNYSRNVPDWQQYNALQSGRTDGTSAAMAATSAGQNTNPNAFVPSISPPSMGGTNPATDCLVKSQNESNFSSRSYHAPPSVASSHGALGTSPLTSMVHMSNCVSHYGGNNHMMEEINNPMDHHRPMNEMTTPVNHMVGPNININGNMGVQNPRIPPTNHHMSSGRHPAYVPCKGSCCSVPDPNLAYQSWDKFGYQVPYRENMHAPGYADDRRFRGGNINIRKDNFSGKSSGGQYHGDQRRAYSGYRKDARNYQQPSVILPNYAMQNYNVPPAEYQKYPPYPMKNYPVCGTPMANGPHNSMMMKYQESGKTAQYQSGMMQNGMMMPSVGAAPAIQNPYYNAPRDFPRENQESVDPGPINRMQPPPTGAVSSPKHQLYRQKFALQRFSLESQLREMMQVPGYLNNPKFKEYTMRYRELVKLQQTVEFQNSIHESSVNPNAPAGSPISPINLQFDQNGVLINSSYLPPNYHESSGPSPEGKQNPPSAMSQQQNPQVQPRNAAEEGQKPDQQKANKDFADKPQLDVRQFLATWDESEEDENAVGSIFGKFDGPVTVVELADLNLVAKEGEGGSSGQGNNRTCIMQVQNCLKKAGAEGDEIEKVVSVVGCISDNGSEIPTIHLVDNLQDKIVVEKIESALSEVKRVKDPGNKADESKEKSDSAVVSNGAEGPEKVDNVDDLSLPDLPICNDTAPSTTLNTPTHTNKENAAEHALRMPANPIEIVQNTSIISFAESPMKMARKSSQDELPFEVMENFLRTSETAKNDGESIIGDVAQETGTLEYEDTDRSELLPREWFSPVPPQKDADEEVSTANPAKENLEVVPESATRKSKNSNAAGEKSFVVSLDEDQFYTEANFSSSSIPLIPGEDTEEPRMPVPPMEGNCLTKIMKNSAPITDLNVLGSDDEKMDKVDDLWMEFSCIDKNLDESFDLDVESAGKFSKIGKHKAQKNATAKNFNEQSNSSVSSSPVLNENEKSRKEGAVNLERRGSYGERPGKNRPRKKDRRWRSKSMEANVSNDEDQAKLLSEFRKLKRKRSIGNPPDKDEVQKMKARCKSSSEERRNVVVQRSKASEVIEEIESPKKKTSDYEIQVSKVNLRINEQDIRKSLLTLKDKNRGGSDVDGIKIEINVSCTDKHSNVKATEKKDDVVDESSENHRQRSHKSRKDDFPNVPEGPTPVIVENPKDKSMEDHAKLPKSNIKFAGESDFSYATKNPRNPGENKYSKIVSLNAENFYPGSSKHYVDKYKNSLTFKNYTSEVSVVSESEDAEAPSGFFNPAFTSLDERDDSNTVPVYTTKDGKIKYSPNRKYTYEVLMKEARESRARQKTREKRKSEVEKKQRFHKYKHHKRENSTKNGKFEKIRDRSVIAVAPSKTAENPPDPPPIGSEKPGDLDEELSFCKKNKCFEEAPENESRSTVIKQLGSILHEEKVAESAPEASETREEEILEDDAGKGTVLEPEKEVPKTGKFRRYSMPVLERPVIERIAMSRRKSLESSIVIESVFHDGSFFTREEISDEAQHVSKDEEPDPSSFLSVPIIPTELKENDADVEENHPVSEVEDKAKTIEEKMEDSCRSENYLEYENMIIKEETEVGEEEEEERILIGSKRFEKSDGDIFEDTNSGIEAPVLIEEEVQTFPCEEVETTREPLWFENKFTEEEEEEPEVGRSAEENEDQSIPKFVIKKSKHPKIPKMIIRNATSRPGTPTIQEVSGFAKTASSDSSAYKPRTRSEEKKKDCESESKIPKMKISLEDKVPKVVIKGMEIHESQKTVPKMKIKKVKNSPEETPCSAFNAEQEKTASSDDRTLGNESSRDKSRKLKMKKESRTTRKRSNSSASQSSVKRSKKWYDASDSATVSDQIPKVIIKRTSPKSEFKCELSKSRKNASEWQPHVKLRRSWVLDYMAKELRHMKVALKLATPRNPESNVDTNKLQWDQFISDLKRQSKLSVSDVSLDKTSSSKGRRNILSLTEGNSDSEDSGSSEFLITKSLDENMNSRDKGSVLGDILRKNFRLNSTNGEEKYISDDACFESISPRRPEEKTLRLCPILSSVVDDDDSCTKMSTASQKLYFDIGRKSKDPGNNDSRSKLENFENAKENFVIKVESSDESQTTIEILPASPESSQEGMDAEKHFVNAVAPHFGLEVEVSSACSLGPPTLMPKELDRVDDSRNAPVPRNNETSKPKTHRESSSRGRDSKRSSRHQSSRPREKLSCSDLLMKEVLAAKETLRRCLKKSCGENISTRNTRPKSCEERKQSCSFNSSSMKRSGENSSKDNKRAKVSSNKERHSRRRERTSGDSRSKEQQSNAAISLKETKNVGDTRIAKSLAISDPTNRQFVHSFQKAIQVIGEMNTIQVQRSQEQMESSDDSLKEENMPVLQLQTEAELGTVSDRDTSRSPPVITNQDSASAENAKIDSFESEELVKALKRKEEDMTIAEVVRELAFHEKATIKDSKYCVLCERWFGSVTRLEKHLSGDQHQRMELTQRRTIHTLFTLFTGRPCPKLLSPDVRRKDYSPNEPTPLQIVVQDIVMDCDKEHETKKQNEEDA